MAFLKFDKAELINLEYSLSREVLRSNRAGSYASTTISGCNTRKYHGLLVCPVDAIDGENHVLLSSLDVTVIQHEQDFNLGIHKYEGDLYIPRGHKYIRDFDAETGSKITYRVGGVVLTREALLVEEQEQVLIRFTLEEAQSPTKLQFRPFLAFRNYHALSKANMYVNTRYRPVKQGIGSRMYEGYPELHMQLSREAEFVPVPDWFYDIEYIEEQKRGYDFKEDLYVPGYFELPIEKGESVVFSASTKEVAPGGLKGRFTTEFSKRLPRDSYRNCLVSSANQFIVRRHGKTQVIAGFPWFGVWGRDTFIALPGLTLSTGDVETAGEVIDTMVSRMKGGLFPNMGSEEAPAFNSVDAPLWFIWSLQQYAKYIHGLDIWERYGKAVREVLEAYRDGTSYNIRMLENGLIHAGEPGKALTWMDAVVHGEPVTPREGCPVEINALWYNAICQALSWAEERDPQFVESWKEMPERIRGSFVDQFWDGDLGYLADYVHLDVRDFSVRPNQVIATSLDYSPITDEMKNAVLERVESELLTPRGLRTLSPKNEHYKGVYEGDQETRDRAYHQGTVWPWLLEHFARGYLDVHKRTGLTLLRRLYDGFEEDMNVAGIGTVSEIYDGNPPHEPRGAISQAWSVAAVLRIGEMIEMYNT